MQKNIINFSKIIFAIATLLIAKSSLAQTISLQLTSSDHNGYGVSCFAGRDGSIDLTVTGGTPPYTFQWSNDQQTEDIIDLPAQYYRVHVVDTNGIEADGEITLTEPEPLKMEVSIYEYPNHFNISLFSACNGIATLTLYGGVAPLNYLWSDGSTNQNRTTLCARNYGVLAIDANGCKVASEKIYLTEPAESRWTQTGNANTDASTNFIGTTDNKDFVFKANSIERFRIGAGGTLGVSGNLNLQNSLLFNNNRSINYQPAQGSIPEILSFGSSPNNSIFSIGSCTTPYLNTQLNYQFNGTIQLYGNSYSGGNLNILEVGFDGANAIIDATGTSTDPIANRLLLNYICGHDVFVGNNTSGDLTANHDFYTYGKVGIGDTYIPTNYRMAVNGKIICEEVFVKLRSAWPDYVFKSDYKLMSLSELKKFINKNGHLPELKSQSEIEQDNGITLGENQSLIVKKIEELTLYIIQQDEKIEKLQKKVDQLTKK